MTLTRKVLSHDVELMCYDLVFGVILKQNNLGCFISLETDIK